MTLCCVVVFVIAVVFYLIFSFLYHLNWNFMELSEHLIVFLVQFTLWIVCSTILVCNVNSFCWYFPICRHCAVNFMKFTFEIRVKVFTKMICMKSEQYVHCAMCLEHRAHSVGSHFEWTKTKKNSINLNVKIFKLFPLEFCLPNKIYQFCKFSWVFLSIYLSFVLVVDLLSVSSHLL